MPKGPGEKRDQEERGIKRTVKGTSRKEGPGGWREEGKRDQKDCQGDQEDGGDQQVWRGQKERGIKRTVKSTCRKGGPAGSSGREGKRDQEDCQGDQQKRRTRRI
jgi:hypothetical protein